MKSWFADTFYFLALRNAKDAAHYSALELTKQRGSRQLVTTGWVLTEVADALSAPTNRAGFFELLTLLRADSAAVIIPCEVDLFDRGIEFYRQRSDKAWTLTDCISFVVMQERNMVEALTGDHHFEQAGFQALLKA